MRRFGSSRIIFAKWDRAKKTPLNAHLLDQIDALLQIEAEVDIVPLNALCLVLRLLFYSAFQRICSL